MITVEIGDQGSGRDVGLFFDVEGGKLLIGLLQDFLAKQSNDHIHLTECLQELDNCSLKPETCALTTRKTSDREHTEAVDLLTLVFREKSW